jgi:prepilin-type N-terminal cleavage/methylation domain-containing protein
MIKRALNKKGFTLIEMLIAVSLFTVVVTISIGALLTIFDANKKARSARTVVDNLNISIENMTRIVRFGKNYHCGTGGALSSPVDCADNVNGNTSMAVTFYDTTLARDVVVAYKLTTISGSGVIQMSYDDGAYTSITDPQANIQLLRFRVSGTSTSPDTNQPYVIAVIKGYVGKDPTSQTTFSLETLMSQRTLDSK